MYQHYYPYTNTIGDPPPPQQSSLIAQIKDNWQYLLLGATGIGFGLIFLHITRKITKKRVGMALTFRTPPAGTKIKPDDLILALNEETINPETAPFLLIKLIEASYILRPGKAISKFMSDPDVRFKLADSGFIEGYPQYEVRHKDLLTPKDQEWTEAISWWVNNWYNASRGKRKETLSEYGQDSSGKPRHSGYLKKNRNAPSVVINQWKKDKKTVTAAIERARENQKELLSKFSEMTGEDRYLGRSRMPLMPSSRAQRELIRPH